MDNDAGTPGRMIRLVWPAEILESSHRRWALLPHLVLALFAGWGPYVDAGSYTAPVFHTLFAIVAPRVWGALFLAVAVLCLHTIITWSWNSYRWANSLHLALCTVWLAMLVWGRLVDHYDVSYPAFGLWGAMVAVGVVVAIVPTHVVRIRERRVPWRPSAPDQVLPAVAVGVLAGASPVVNQASDLDVSSILVAVIGAAAGFGGSTLMYRGKVTDSANWLVKSLREDAEAAREAASVARAEASVAREDARRAWQRVDACEQKHADTTTYLHQLVDNLRRAGVPMPDLPLPQHLHVDPDAQGPPEY